MTPVVFYWHNGRSLGHTSRTATIGAALLARRPATAVFGLTGASRGLELLPHEMDVLKIPSYRAFDLATGLTVQPVAAISKTELVRVRSRVIKSFIDELVPATVVVDFFPTGRNGELLEAFQGKETPRLLGLRGVLGTSESTNAEFFNPAMTAFIDRTYTAILVYTDPDLLDLESLYRVPPSLRAKLQYTGYVARHCLLSRCDARDSLGLEREGPLVLITFGGAQGALPLYDVALRACDVLPKDAHVVVAIGPYLVKDEVAAIRRMTFSDRRLQIAPLLLDVPTWMRACDLFIGAAGYNTIAEVLANTPNAIIVPRQLNEQEQALHAGALATRGLARVIPHESFTVAGLRASIVEAMREPTPHGRQRYRVHGAAEAAARIEALL